MFGSRPTFPSPWSAASTRREGPPEDVCLRGPRADLDVDVPGAEAAKPQEFFDNLDTWSPPGNGRASEGYPGPLRRIGAPSGSMGEMYEVWVGAVGTGANLGVSRCECDADWAGRPGMVPQGRMMVPRRMGIAGTSVAERSFLLSRLQPTVRRDGGGWERETTRSRAVDGNPLAGTERGM